MALVALLLPPLLAPLAWLLAWPSRLLLLVAHGFAALPMAQWQTGRPQPLLVLLFTLALLVLLVPPLARRWRWLALALLMLVGVLHTAALRADSLLLVHQGGGDLLVARHQGRAALVATRADPFLCQQARRLAQGLGVTRFDWLLLLDPVAPAEPLCWSEQAGLSLLGGDATAPLAAGQRLASGLEAGPGHGQPVLGAGGGAPALAVAAGSPGSAIAGVPGGEGSPRISPGDRSTPCRSGSRWSARRSSGDPGPGVRGLARFRPPPFRAPPAAL